MAAQCIQLDQLLCELLLTDGQDIAEELKPHMSPKQQEIIDYFHYKDSRPTLGLVQLWMVALRRALVDSKSPDELLLNWISHNFANAQSKNTMTTPIDLFTNKSLLAFIDRLRSKYRNPLVHASSEPSPKFNKSEYKVWCNDAYGSPTLSKWLHKGWTGDMGWISALVCSAKIN
jgi:hypothetical protein